MISVTSEMNEVTLLTIKGKLISIDDVEDLYQTIRAIINDDHKKILMDLKNVNWISSMGIGALMRCLTTIRNTGGDLKLSGVSDKVKNIFTITKLDSVFQVFSSLEEAIKSFD